LAVAARLPGTPGDRSAALDGQLCDLRCHCTPASRVTAGRARQTNLGLVDCPVTPITPPYLALVVSSPRGLLAGLDRQRWARDGAAIRLAVYGGRGGRDCEER
jgi:hypothetical protein